MTEAFIGLTVELTLNDGFTVQGIVSMVNPATQRLQLEHDRAETPLTEATDSDVPVDVRPRSARKKRTPKTVSKSRAGSHRHTTSDANEWAAGDVNEFIEEDFDFQQNLILFDKKKVFEEIRETDNTAPEDRLVSHNRREGRSRNLLPTENVLSRASPEEETDNGSDGEPWRDNNERRSYTFKTTDGSPCWAVTGVQMLEVERMAGR
ncbi:hypothetical protein SYNPS1DRAFT_25782 [Syncephalis pseudoplumigaleata]|uniref:DFDF domain-containing protein n=1 Tax=Syncephalis pseudoplumigaleata TaxID=1712513 RepID=A0A4P9YRH9_9FUNG|nr:hypothetical protein SYNPS1DRAFT_25782 [Syncephalis pseudoplumigaleata]|eukprot:RKP22466.1 hypothetical protein SYNPS1DRAFT_25782 [Syncephalis pseudoplumigaleata]